MSTRNEGRTLRRSGGSRIFFYSAAVLLTVGAVVLAAMIPRAYHCTRFSLPVPAACVVDYRWPLRVAMAGMGVVLALVLAGVGRTLDRR